MASLLLGVLSLVALLGLGGDLHRGVYLLIFSGVIGIAGCVIGITAVVKARWTGSYRPRGAVGGIVLGTMAALLSIPILATYLAGAAGGVLVVRIAPTTVLESAPIRGFCCGLLTGIVLGIGAAFAGAQRISAGSGQRRRSA